MLPYGVDGCTAEERPKCVVDFMSRAAPQSISAVPSRNEGSKVNTIGLHFMQLHNKHKRASHISTRTAGPALRNNPV